MELITIGLACFAFLWLAVLFLSMSARIAEGSVAEVQGNAAVQAIYVGAEK